MNDARQIWLVARREIRERGRSRGFLASLLVMLVVVAAAIALPAVLDSGPGAKDVGFSGDTPPGLTAAVQAQGDAVDTTIRVHRFDTVEEGEAAVRDRDVDVLVVDARRLEWTNRVDEQLKAVVTGAIQLLAVQDRAEAAGIEPDQLLAIVEPVPVANVELGRVEGRSPDDETAAILMTMVLFFAISTYGAMVLSGVVEEKSSRTVEVLLARMSARNLLAGKIAGIGLLGLAQITATALVALIAASATDSFDVPAVRGAVIVWAVVWFVLGYALYATTFGTLGSLASRTEDASTVTGPVSVVLVLAFMVSFATVPSADTTWARIVSWVPLTAPLATPNRIAMGVATWWDPVVAVVLTLATIAGLVVLGGRVYTRAILHTGPTLSIREAWREAPVASESAADPTRAPGAKEVHATARPAAREARTSVILVLIGIAVGVAVIVITSDVIIGIGVGAAVFALGRQAVRIWGRDHDRSGRSDETDHELLHR
jgi:ABC-2 type transport system permease protein